MEKKKIGAFYGISFDGEIYKFIVLSNNKIICPEESPKEFDRVILKPRFLLVDGKVNSKFLGEWHESHAPHKTIDGLIKEYQIEPELFDHLIANNMLGYSADMAEFYGFPCEYAYDKQKGMHQFKGKPFKWASKKGPVLVKQKSGHFN